MVRWTIVCRVMSRLIDGYQRAGDLSSKCSHNRHVCDNRRVQLCGVSFNHLRA